MGHVAFDFVKTYYKSILLFITPIIFSPLLTLNELETIPNDELYDIYRTKEETMNQTLTRLNENPPTLYKVGFLDLELQALNRSCYFLNAIFSALMLYSLW